MATNIWLLTERTPKSNPNWFGFLFRHVVQNPIAVVAGDDLFAAPHVGHDLRPQSHVTRHARAVARFGERDAVANARTDPFVKRARRFWQITEQPLMFRAR